MKKKTFSSRMTTTEELAVYTSEYVAITQQLKEMRQRFLTISKQYRSEIDPLKKRLEDLDKRIVEGLRQRDIRGVRRGDISFTLEKKAMLVPKEDRIKTVIEQSTHLPPETLYQKILRAMKSRQYNDEVFDQVLKVKYEKIK